MARERPRVLILGASGPQVDAIRVGQGLGQERLGLNAGANL